VIPLSGELKGEHAPQPSVRALDQRKAPVAWEWRDPSSLGPSASSPRLDCKLPGWFQTYFEHALPGPGNQFRSGIGSDVRELTLLTAFVIWIRQRNRHVQRCWRLAWRPHPVHGHPVCRHHHPDYRRISANPPSADIRELNVMLGGCCPVVGRDSGRRRLTRFPNVGALPICQCCVAVAFPRPSSVT
jgi:hypothetical protein